MLVFVLCYPSKADLFSNERQKGSGSGWEGMQGGGTGCGEELGGTLIGIYYVRKKNLLSREGKYKSSLLYKAKMAAF